MWFAARAVFVRLFEEFLSTRTLLSIQKFLFQKSEFYSGHMAECVVNSQEPVLCAACMNERVRERGRGKEDRASGPDRRQQVVGRPTRLRDEGRQTFSRGH